MCFHAWKLERPEKFESGEYNIGRQNAKTAYCRCEKVREFSGQVELDAGKVPLLSSISGKS
jgi:hypothetical protein